MSKIIFSIILISTFSLFLAADIVPCDSKGKYSCTVGQTCCRNKVSQTGWACFPISNGVCCSDGLSICPSNTYCDLRNKTCNSMTSLAFLEVPESSNEKNIEAQLTLSPLEALSFTKGLIEGVEVFNGLAHSKDCNPADPQLVQDVVDIVHTLQGLNVHSEFVKILEEIVAKGEDAYKRISTTSQGCKALAGDFEVRFNELVAYVKSQNIEKVAFHALEHIRKIKTLSAQGKSDLAAGKYYDAGKSFGALVKILAFWNFKF